ncbi:MAG: APC family permease [Ornithinimicrobium sp.]|uniref:APC family permease n=1 Tax=Ornithinimicrobium sp. TaxID=1977084 RepID=UPI0017B127ED|nr:APC family permease [Actinomycetota bacterium]
MANATETDADFTRVLGQWDVLAIAFGAMIGFGWIVLTGGFLEDAGTMGAALAFVLGGIVMGFVGLTYAELVAAMPQVGGEHQYVLRAIGSRAAFVCSWFLVLGYVSVVAFEAVALPQTMLFLFPDMLAIKLWTIAGYEVYLSWVAVGVVAAVVMTYINYRGVRPAAAFQTIAVLFLMAVGLALIFGSFVGGDTEQMQPLFTGGATGIIAVLVATPFLFVGFDVIPQSAEEINLPYRKIGIMLLISVAAAVSWYIMIMLTVGSSLPAATLAESELAVADGMAALWGSQTMGNLLVIGGIAGILTSWNGFLIGASRLTYAMATSGMLPRWFGKLHPRYRTPSNALIFIGGLSVLAPIFGRQMLVWLVDAGGVSLIIAFVMVAISFVMLRRREPDMERPFRTPGGVGTGITAIVLATGLGVLFLPGMPSALIWPYEWIIFGGWGLAGALLITRIPHVGPGPDSHDEMIRVAAKRGVPQDQPPPV